MAIYLLSMVLMLTFASTKQHLTDDQISAYTMNNSIPIEYMMVDDSNKGMGTHYKYSSASIDSMIRSSAKVVAKMKVLLAREKAEGKTPYIDKRQLLLYSAVKHAHLLRGANILVIGSAEPYLEAFLLAVAGEQDPPAPVTITVLEYNKLTYNHTAIRTVSHDHFEAFYAKVAAGTTRFNIVFSASTFDHDGLGRYNDPMSADADIRAMRRLYTELFPQCDPGSPRESCVPPVQPQYLFLSLPIGRDLVVFNMLRRYGAVRLPHMLYRYQERAHIVSSGAKDVCVAVAGDVDSSNGNVNSNCGTTEDVEVAEEVLLWHSLRNRNGTRANNGFSYVLSAEPSVTCAGRADVTMYSAKFTAFSNSTQEGVVQLQLQTRPVLGLGSCESAPTAAVASKRVVYTDRVGWNENSLEYSGSYRQSLEPVLLLQRGHANTCCGWGTAEEHICGLDEYVTLLEAEDELRSQSEQVL